MVVFIFHQDDFVMHCDEDDAASLDAARAGPASAGPAPAYLLVEPVRAHLYHRFSVAGSRKYWLVP